MKNAKDELFKIIGDSKILCVDINIQANSLCNWDTLGSSSGRKLQKVKVNTDYFNNPLIEKLVDDDEIGEKPIQYRSISIRLFPGYETTEYENFVKALDIEYDNGFGSQILFGIIWMVDGTWLSRWEYDGSEGWDWNRVPELPVDFKRAFHIDKIIN